MQEPNPLLTPCPWRCESQLESVLRDTPENVQNIRRLFQYGLFHDQDMRNVLSQFTTERLNGLLCILGDKGFRLGGEQKVEEMLGRQRQLSSSFTPFHIEDADTAADAIHRAVQQVPFETWVQRALRWKSFTIGLLMEQREELSAQLVFWKEHNLVDFKSLCEVSLCDPFICFYDANRVKKLGRNPLSNEDFDISFVIDPLAEFFSTHRNENLANILE